MKTLDTRGMRRLLMGGLLVGLGASMTLRGEEFKEEFQQTYPLTAEGRIALEHVNGKVRILAWDRAEVKLEAVKRGKRKEDVDAVKIEIEAKADRLSVHTRYPESKSWFGRRRENSTSVDYTLNVPRTARLEKVSSVNGSIEIEGVCGAVTASTVNGGVKASGLAAETELSSVNGGVKAGFERWDGVKSVSLKTVNGGVDLELPAGADADLSASTLNGNISGDVAVQKNWPVGREVKTRLGKGGPKIEVSSVNGSLRFHLAGTAEKN